MATNLDLKRIVNSLHSLRSKISVDGSFSGQMNQINALLDNDRTGYVNTISDFMIHTATTNMKIETKNDGFNEILNQWQSKLLNKNVGIDIPAGLRSLSTQYFKERWKSSFIVLNIVWDSFDFEGQSWELPSRMYLSAGASVTVSGEISSLNGKIYEIGKKTLKNSKTTSVLIRKPYNSWYEDYPTPYLVRRGVLFNSMLKQAIITKQSDVIEVIIPYLLNIQAGSDFLARQNMLPDAKEFKDLKKQFVDASRKQRDNDDFGEMISTLSYDVNVEHFMPDLKKIFDAGIVQSVDKDILAGMGMIELQGFASNRQETMLNPKVMVEEIKDAVLDWSQLLEEVMQQMIDRNSKDHRNLTKQPIRVVPGIIKAFITDDMRSMLRSMYDRGIISKRTGGDIIADIDFEVEVDRRDAETGQDLDKRMKPPIIQNLEQYDEPNNLENEDKKPGTPEADNFNNAIVQAWVESKKLKKEEKKIVSYKTIDDLPEDIKSSLTIPEQIKYIKDLNK